MPYLLTVVTGFVELPLSTKLSITPLKVLEKEMDEETAAKHGLDVMYRWKERPLYADKMQVQLVDPNDR